MSDQFPADRWQHQRGDRPMENMTIRPDGSVWIDGQRADGMEAIDRVEANLQQLDDAETLRAAMLARQRGPTYY